MSAADKNNPTKFIGDVDQTAREALGFDDDTLLRELKQAELDWEQEKAADPDREVQTARETEAGFAKLWDKIRQDHLTPVSESEYAEKKAAEEQKIIRMKSIRRTILVAALAGVMLLGTGFTVLAMKNFQYHRVKVGTVKNQVVWSNDEYPWKAGNLPEAYQAVAEEIGEKNALIIGNKPSTLEFKQLSITEGRTKLEFSYKGKVLYFRQTRGSDSEDKITESFVSDRHEVEMVHNDWLSTDIPIGVNYLQSGDVECSAGFEIGDTYYYLEAMMDKESFIKIIESLDHYREYQK